MRKPYTDEEVEALRRELSEQSLTEEDIAWLEAQHQLTQNRDEGDTHGA